MRLLLDDGADVNQTFGENQTYVSSVELSKLFLIPLLNRINHRSPLQWALLLGRYDITRLLLDRDADGAHVSCYGWTPVVYLLEGAQRFQQTESHNLLDFLDILNHDRVDIDTDTQDHFGQNALQLAAAWYPGPVIERLFRLGASFSVFGQNPWAYPANPIWNAIYSNNTSAFRVLLRHYPEVDAVDGRHLRMLNYTARNGNVEMTELLLEQGAGEILPNYNLRNDENDAGFDMIDDASDTDGLKKWTKESYLKYMDILERFDRIVIQTTYTEDGVDQDIYWDADTDLIQWYY